MSKRVLTPEIIEQIEKRITAGKTVEVFATADNTVTVVSVKREGAQKIKATRQNKQ